MKRLAMFLFAGFFAQSAAATILPPNNLHLEDNLNIVANMTETEFNAIVQQAADVYGPVIAAKGKRLVTNNNWKSTTVNASAQQSGNNWIINMYGGLARRAEVTKDGFMLVVCHELGHHLGGFPIKFGWAANEGQSDYFATLGCAREVWRDEVAENAKFRATVEAYPKELCDQAWTSEADQDLCYRSMAAGHSLGSLLAVLRKAGAVVNYDTPDGSEVGRTNGAHPEAQCRLDTYMAGAVCVQEWDIDLIPQSEKAARPVTCTRVDEFELGPRPRCWYAPTLKS